MGSIDAEGKSVGTPPSAAAAPSRPVRPASRPPLGRSNPVTSTMVRAFGVVMLVGSGLIGALLWWTGRIRAASYVWTAGALIGLFALALPGPAAPVYRAWMATAQVLGRINTTILLTLFYVVMICGTALIFRLIGRDALRLRKKAADSYWEPKRMSEDPAAYFNQY